MPNIIDYKKIMQTASLRAVKYILLDVSKNGLPGKHHFYISFSTKNSGVQISSSLKEQYSEEMTIVIQNWYDDFIVNDEEFYITLNFGNVKETMKIPFSSVKSFVDPSVEFGLSFDYQKDANLSPITKEQPDGHEPMEANDELDIEKVIEKKSGEVVSLESFRKS